MPAKSEKKKQSPIIAGWPAPTRTSVFANEEDDPDKLYSGGGLRFKVQGSRAPEAHYNLFTQ